MGFNFEVNRFIKNVGWFEAVYKSMNNKQRTMNYELRTDKAFTLIELVVAVALLAMVLGFASVIFKVSIEAYRTAGANTEIMQKLRAVTDQLNTDFKGLRKDGYLILFSEVQFDRREYQNSDPCDFRADRLYYFSAGDFQSWFDPDIRSNIARVYFGHDSISLDPVVGVTVSEWNLARDVMLLTPEYSSSVDCNGISYAERKVNWWDTMADANNLFDLGIPIDIQTDPNDVRRLMCQNAGEIIIEWTDGEMNPPPDNSLIWFGLLVPSENPYIEPELDTSTYTAIWAPTTPKQYWPKALKFTFTLYDSKGIIENGRRFTHIVYVGN